MTDDRNLMGEGFGLIRWLSTTLAITHGAALFGLLTAAVFDDKLPSWVRLLFIPSAWAFTIGLLFAAGGVAHLVFHHLTHATKTTSKWESGFATFSFLALLCGILWPLGHVTAAAFDGVL